MAQPHRPQADDTQTHHPRLLVNQAASRTRYPTRPPRAPDQSVEDPSSKTTRTRAISSRTLLVVSRTRLRARISLFLDRRGWVARMRWVRGDKRGARIREKGSWVSLGAEQ